MLGKYRSILSRQQISTLKGQIIKGHTDAAVKGLHRLVSGKKRPGGD